MNIEKLLNNICDLIEQTRAIEAYEKSGQLPDKDYKSIWADLRKTRRKLVNQIKRFDARSV